MTSPASWSWMEDSNLTPPGVWDPRAASAIHETMKYKLRRLDSHQRSPAYEAGEDGCSSTPQQCFRQGSNLRPLASEASALVQLSYGSVELLCNQLVPPLRIERRSPGLQPGALTHSARAAGGGPYGNR